MLMILIEHSKLVIIINKSKMLKIRLKIIDLLSKGLLAVIYLLY